MSLCLESEHVMSVARVRDSFVMVLKVVMNHGGLSVFVVFGLNVGL